MAREHSDQKITRISDEPTRNLNPETMRPGRPIKTDTAVRNVPSPEGVGDNAGSGKLPRTR